MLLVQSVAQGLDLVVRDPPSNGLLNGPMKALVKVLCVNNKLYYMV